MIAIQVDKAEIGMKADSAQLPPAFGKFKAQRIMK
jgi:hypothetical protein